MSPWVNIIELITTKASLFFTRNIVARTKKIKTCCARQNFGPQFFIHPFNCIFAMWLYIYYFKVYLPASWLWTWRFNLSCQWDVSRCISSRRLKCACVVKLAISCFGHYENKWPQEAHWSQKNEISEKTHNLVK